MQAYCPKCQTKRDKKVQNITPKTGKPLMKGICPVC